MAFLPTQPYKGTRDFYPAEMRVRRWIFDQMREVCESYGYGEYDGPMLESFELYAAKSGEELVSQQLYHLIDRGERKVAIRPEMTPTMARMVAGKINELARPVRLYSIPNLWRYERPQRGRLREFWQLNVDVLGGDPVRADAEILSLSWDLMKKFGGEKHVAIKVNNRRMVDAFFKGHLKLSEETVKAVMRVVDARAKMEPKDFDEKLVALGMTSEQRQDLDRYFKNSYAEQRAAFGMQGQAGEIELGLLLQELGARGIGVEYDPSLMRGLDYYTGTVFEMFDVSPENNRAMFGGGRYDNLLGLFGKHSLSGVGLGMGDVTLENFLETHGLMPKLPPFVDVFVSESEIAGPECGKLAARLRDAGLRVMSPLEVSGFGPQLKLAAKHGARIAVLFGESEWAEKKVVVKNLQTGAQEVVPLANAVEACRR